MSLRTRLVVSTTAIVLVVVALLSIGVQQTVSRQLLHEIDHTLDARVELIRAQLRDNSQMGVLGRRQRNPLGEALLPTRFDTVTQVIDPSGAIVIGIGDIDLPVAPKDIAIADGTRTGISRSTVNIEGVSYRLLTVPIQRGGALQLAKDMREIERAKQGILRWIIGFGALGIVLAVSAGLVLARRVSRPIMQLASAAENIAITRDVTSPLTVRGDSEVANLATSFNTMLAALGTSMTQQRQLVQDASHELRTPLTSLRANSELLERSDISAETRSEILKDMRAEVDELAQLSIELSALASDQRLDEALESTSLEQAVHNVVARARRRSGREIGVVAQTPATVALRAAQFERALSNLVDNALKFCPTSQAIEIEIKNKRISVIDHGAGISDADKPHVFNRFYRAAATRALPGSGLGLAIVAQFADDHDATTFVTDTVGGGATVGIEFK